mgnify:CR=1 FL=1
MRSIDLGHYLLVASFAGVESYTFSHRRHFILLHGSGTSGAAFPNSPTNKGAKSFMQGVPRRVDANSGLVPANWQWVALDAGNDEGTWLLNLASSVAAVEAELEAGGGKYSGIVGHEQGGTLAAIVAARAALGEGPLSLEFAVISGAAMPADPPYTDLLRRLRDSPDKEIRTLHCLSKLDTVSPPELGEELAGCFGQTAEVLWHDRGNAMPDKSWWKATRAFPDRATGQKRYVDQFNIGNLFEQDTFLARASNNIPVGQ